VRKRTAQRACTAPAVSEMQKEKQELALLAAGAVKRNQNKLGFLNIAAPNLEGTSLSGFLKTEDVELHRAAALRLVRKEDIPVVSKTGVCRNTVRLWLKGRLSSQMCIAKCLDHLSFRAKNSAGPGQVGSLPELVERFGHESSNRCLLDVAFLAGGFPVDAWRGAPFPDSLAEVLSGPPMSQVARCLNAHGTGDDLSSFQDTIPVGLCLQRGRMAHHPARPGNCLAKHIAFHICVEAMALSAQRDEARGDFRGLTDKELLLLLEGGSSDKDQQDAWQDRDVRLRALRSVIWLDRLREKSEQQLQKGQEWVPYHTLGISPDASQREINLAYREKARLLHPDRSGAHNTQAFQELQAAYDQLKDPEVVVTELKDVKDKKKVDKFDLPFEAPDSSLNDIKKFSDKLANACEYIEMLSKNWGAEMPPDFNPTLSLQVPADGAASIAESLGKKCGELAEKLLEAIKPLRKQVVEAWQTYPQRRAPVIPLMEALQRDLSNTQAMAEEVLSLGNAVVATAEGIERKAQNMFSNPYDAYNNQLRLRADVRFCTTQGTACFLGLSEALATLPNLRKACSNASAAFSRCELMRGRKDREEKPDPGIVPKPKPRPKPPAAAAAPDGAAKRQPPPPPPPQTPRRDVAPEPTPEPEPSPKSSASSDEFKDCYSNPDNMSPERQALDNEEEDEDIDSPTDSESEEEDTSTIEWKLGSDFMQDQLIDFREHCQQVLDAQMRLRERINSQLGCIDQVSREQKAAIFQLLDELILSIRADFQLPEERCRGDGGAGDVADRLDDDEAEAFDVEMGLPPDADSQPQQLLLLPESARRGPALEILTSKWWRKLQFLFAASAWRTVPQPSFEARLVRVAALLDIGRCYRWLDFRLVKPLSRQAEGKIGGSNFQRDLRESMEELYMFTSSRINVNSFGGSGSGSGSADRTDFQSDCAENAAAAATSAGPSNGASRTGGA